MLIAECLNCGAPEEGFWDGFCSDDCYIEYASEEYTSSSSDPPEPNEDGGEA